MLKLMTRKKWVCGATSYGHSIEDVTPKAVALSDELAQGNCSVDILRELERIPFDPDRYDYRIGKLDSMDFTHVVRENKPEYWHLKEAYRFRA